MALESGGGIVARETRGGFRRLESVFLQAARLKRGGVFRRNITLRGLFARAAASALRRGVVRLRGGLAPVAITLSPTMRCNLSCTGCYALDYPRNDELPSETIGRVLAAAARMGVFLVIVTGGEPLLRPDIVELFGKHGRLLFLLVTNGTLVDRKQAGAMARAGNIVPVVSLEGPRAMTDARRGSGVYDAAVRAMGRFADERLLFGYSSMVTSENWSQLVGPEFISEMIERGCGIGFYTEYVPVGSGVRWGWVLGDRERRLFREGVLSIRRTRPLITAHLPDDEYDKRNRCLGVTSGCVHVNAQGCVEPCPFAHFATDNVREKPLAEAVGSKFLAEVRASEAVIRRGHVGCALVENRALLEDIARRAGAAPTDRQ